MVLVNTLINSAFEIASQKNNEVNKKWIKFSHFTGSQLPHTHFTSSIQDIGHIDLLLRCMEDELAMDSHPHHLTYLRLLSNLWVGSCYEVFRVINQKIKNEREEFNKVFKTLTLIRVGIEKHEIANDKKLKTPIQFVSEVNVEAHYDYIPNDEKRSYTIATGISNNGSIMWEVLDIASSLQPFWVERRTLSNDVIALFN